MRSFIRNRNSLRSLEDSRENYFNSTNSYPNQNHLTTLDEIDFSEELFTGSRDYNNSGFQAKQGSCSRQSRRMNWTFREFINGEFTVPRGCRRVRITFTSKWVAYDNGSPCCESGPERIPFMMDGGRPRQVQIGSNVCGDRSGEPEAPGSYITRSLSYNLSPGNHRWRMETGISDTEPGCVRKVDLRPMLIEIY